MLIKIRINQKNNNIDSKLLNVLDYLKRLNDEINDGKLLFNGSNKEIINFITFNKPLNFISAIFIGEISFKKAEINQRNLNKK